MLQNVTGQRVDYETFKAEFDAGGPLRDIVDKFDAKGVTVKTKEKEEPAGKSDSGKSAVNSMAKRAAANTLKR
jgi:hypothetical protein